MEIVRPTGVTSNGLTFAASVDEGILRAHDENHLATALVGGAAGGSEGVPAPQEENRRRETNRVSWLIGYTRESFWEKFIDQAGLKHI